ncbi:MAG: 2TM domain-containing protein [Planctomycetia bacterium]|nr:2TM domain-containing protein [Planctomycetia bacterium]
MDDLDRLAAATRIVNARIGFAIHALVFVLVNALLIAINLATTPRLHWFWWPLACWGAGLLFHAALLLLYTWGRDLHRRLIERELQARRLER